MIILSPNVNAARLNYSSPCEEEGILNAVRIIGYIITIAKILVPLLIIVFGMIDFAKAVTASDEKAINKATASLIKRVIAGVVVFFIPTLVMAGIGVLEITNGIESDDPNRSDFATCTKCIFDTSTCPSSTN